MKLRFLLVVLVFVTGLSAQKSPELHQIEELISLGKFEAAESLLLQAVQNNSTPELQDRLGEVYGFQQKWDKAIEVYSQLSESFPQNADYSFKYGGSLAKKAQNGNKFRALTLVSKIKSNLKRAVEIDPGHIQAYWALVDLYVSLPGILGGSNSRAMEYAKRLQSISTLDGYLATGYVYEYDDKPEQAKKAYMQALQLLGNFKTLSRNQLHYQIGKICGTYGTRIEQGIWHMRQYIENYTALDGVPLEWAHYRMAKLHRKNGATDKALASIENALKLKNSFGPALEEKEKILSP
ncbi:tetratricopeptide repeat protein [Poritiphilus flavus]|uniref:Tetratricopeptide repeat protein n=1 Tax=Poritiphilus flavus TaxID=2697053 RepID=A0A6L9EHA4_9FLAO|nr:tetratricopeptide repeat protein [Poritiphilus flavus]NAS14177.1 tetratricopeptide repeat protein [Poritiphilus flavus]